MPYRVFFYEDTFYGDGKTKVYVGKPLKSLQGAMNKVNKLDNVQGIINNCNRDEINAIITMIKLKQSEFQYTAARQFAVGDRVSFESRKGNFLEGLISND